MKTIRTFKPHRAKNRTVCRLFIVAAFLATLPVGLAEGFRNATIGALDLGRSGGRIAQVDDSTAVQHNPANLVELTNAQAQFTPNVIYIRAKFQSPAIPGQSAQTIKPWKALPNFFVAVPLDNSRFAAGLGVTMPFGLGNEWNTASSAFSQRSGILTYVAPHFSQLITVNVNPTLAFKLTDSLQLGIGFDAMWSDLEFKQFLSPAVPNLEADAEGNGWGYGGNLGITWEINKQQSLAFTYRSTMTVDYSGTTKFSDFSGAPNTSFGSQIKFPNMFAVGYGIKLPHKVRLESDFEWLQFSQFKNLGINIGPNLLGVPSQNIPEKWHNTFTAGIGGDWQFASHWVLRAGYQYFESPVPNSTFSPTIPDANQNVLTVGVGWQNRHNSLELAYGLDFYNDRHITNDQNPAYNGKYTFNVHLFSLAYTYKL